MGRVGFLYELQGLKAYFLPPTIWVHAYGCSVDRYAKKNFFLFESCGFSFLLGQPAFFLYIS